jgi:hypothetical protein
MTKSLVGRLVPDQLWALVQLCCPPAWLRERGSPGGEWSRHSGLGKWLKAERTIAWLFGCRRLRMRYERSDARFYTFVLLACSLLSFQILRQPPW